MKRNGPLRGTFRIKIEELLGQKYGKLTVIGEGKQIGPQRYLVCRCDCGVELEVRMQHLRNGHTKSCGCMGNITHGLSKHPLFHVWSSMKQRCGNKKSSGYENYGERGIKVCNERLNSFETFYSDMGQKYRKGLYLDRIDNNKGYSKDNCKRVTSKENCRNTRANKKITYKGETHLQVERLEILGIKLGHYGRTKYKE